MSSYDEVIKELEEETEKFSEIQLDKDKDSEYDGHFRFEYAFESLTERNSVYKRRKSNA